MKRSVVGKITFYVSNIQIRRKNNFSSNHIIDNFVPLCLNTLQYLVQDFKRTSETKISYTMSLLSIMELDVETKGFRDQ